MITRCKSTSSLEKKILSFQCSMFTFFIIL
nr:MAG TPA: hypothetical protein [Caudoviricetes sp.]